MKKYIFIFFILLCNLAFSEDYYIDYDNGIDTAAGTKQGNFTADSGTNTTTIVDSELDGLTITDNAASSGDFVWNVTRSAGSYVDAWDDGTDTITLTGTISGQTTGDTYYILSAWKTISQYTTTTTRTAGDRGFMRANITWDQGTEATDVIFDDDGNIDNYISLIGCDSVTNDPWNDASDIKPIVDFQNQSYQFNMNSDNYWYIERLHLKQGNDGGGMWTISSCLGTYIKDCNFTDNNSASVEGIVGNLTQQLTLDSCVFENCFGRSFTAISTKANVKSCSFIAGSDVSTDYGIVGDNSSQFCVTDCTFTGTFDIDEISSQDASSIKARNNGASDISVSGNAEYLSEDDSGTFESHVSRLTPGTITRDASTVRSGGATTSAKMEPNSGCGPNQPLILGDFCYGFRPIRVAAGSYTATVYVRVGTAWDSALTSSEVYMVTSELDNASTTDRVERTSTETIANDGTWTALTTSVSPAREGFIYFWLYLAEFEDATEHIFVDVLPTVK